MINTKNELIKLFKEIKYAPFPEMKPYIGLANQFSEYALEMICDELVARGVTVQLCKPGDEIWVIERKDNKPVDITSVVFFAKSKECIIATPWIHDCNADKILNIDETIQDHIAETNCNGEVGVMIYPEEDCFATKEEAEDALQKENVKND